MTLLGRDGLLQIGRPDQKQECCAGQSGPTLTTPQSVAADQFGDAAQVDERLWCGERVRNNPRKGRWVDQVDDAADAESNGDDER